jgi:hypothetical protein
MGEASKTSGENGEKITEEILRLIGWVSPMKGVSVPCIYKAVHEKTTHGNDFIYMYNNPLHDCRTDIVYISTKNESKGYSKGEQGVRTTFKKHILELDKIIACSKVGSKVGDAIRSFGGRKQKKHIGLLFWLHGNESEIQRDIKPNLGAVQIDLESGCPVYLVDMARASFIKDAIDHFKATKHGNYSFYYPKLGNVLAPIDERHGAILPIELLASDLIPIRFNLENKPALCIYAKQNFSEEALKKLCSLAFEFADGWVEDIFIGIESYHPADDKEKKDLVLMGFKERAANIRVFCYKKSILDLLEC